MRDLETVRQEFTTACAKVGALMFDREKFNETVELQLKPLFDLQKQLETEYLEIQAQTPATPATPATPELPTKSKKSK